MMERRDVQVTTGHGAPLSLQHEALTPRSTATFTDDPLVSGTTYDFELQSVYQGWTSTSTRVDHHPDLSLVRRRPG